jgi:hypothetical protein
MSSSSIIQYFMTIAQIEDAVLSQITGNTDDYNTLLNALQTAAAAVQALYPSDTLHFSTWAYQALSSQWVQQINIYRGESSPMNHWDTSLTMSMTEVEGNYTAIVSTLQIINYTQSQSALGDFTPPSVANS